MANNIWRGDSVPVAQLNTITPANVLVGNIFILVINGKGIIFTATVATVANVTAGLAAAVAASTIPEFLEVTAADITTALTLTANTAGMPFTQTSSASGGTATLTTVVTTASQGPNDWNVSNNWTLNAVPVDTNNVYITGDVDILYGIDQSGVSLASLNFDSNYTGQVGLPLINASGGYYEYRPTRLAIGASTINIGKGVGSGSGRMRLDPGDHDTVINIYNTGSAIDPLGAVDIKGSGSTYTFNVLKGSVGVATEPGQIATIDVFRIGFENNQAGDVSLYLGSGVALTTMSQCGGAAILYCGATTYNINGGIATLFGTGTITTLTIDAGTFYHQSTGTITTLKIGTGGTADFSQDQRTRTITNTTLVAGSALIDTYKVITFTNPIAFDRCSLSEVNLDLGTNFNLQRS